MVLPPNYAAKLPGIDELPPGFRAFVNEMRERRGGKLIFETYVAARPVPQPPLPARSFRLSLSDLLRTPWVLRFGAKLAVAYGGIIRYGNTAIAARWRDVDEVLRRDLDFHIAPVNGRRIDAVNGPFVLGLDRGERLAAERAQLYAAVSRIDLDAVRALVAEEANGCSTTPCACTASWKSSTAMRGSSRPGRPCTCSGWRDRPRASRFGSPGPSFSTRS